MKSRALIVLPLLLLLAGCGSSSKSSSSSTGSSSAPASPGATSTSSSGGASAGGSGGTVHVVMQNIAFSPTTVNAKVGQTVAWVNKDSVAHNVTYVSGPKFTSSSTLNNGQSFSIKLSQPGTIHYFCSIHPFMKATIVVSK